MQEIRIEVCSDTEAYEICTANGYTFAKLYKGKGQNSGKLMMLAYSYASGEQISMFNNPTMPAVMTQPKVVVTTSTLNKNYGVRTLYNNESYMYVSAHGTTFNIYEALRMTEEQAKKKAFFMSRHGRYRWEVFRFYN